MCLYTKANAAPKVAEKDIECYKFLIHFDKVGYKTPCQYTVLNDNIVEGKTDFKAKGLQRITKTGRHDTHNNICRTYIEVGSGFIHTFITLSDAETFVKKWQSVSLDRAWTPCVIFKCVIPKGTEYYKGYLSTINGKDDCYASPRIRFVEKVKTL
jgi:hypothetical protein